MMLVEATTKSGDWVGALIASNTNYITHQAAERLALAGEPITLVYGVDGMEVRVETKGYCVSLKVATKKGDMAAPLDALLWAGGDRQSGPCSGLGAPGEILPRCCHTGELTPPEEVTLPNNRKAVKVVFLKSEEHFERDQKWSEAYARQVHDMVARGAAVKLSRAAMDSWNGAVWWVNHLTAPNPHSVSTPVRLVWDSSREFRGLSLNGILLKGPDVLNPIRAVLLCFREGEYAAVGDVSKMYNSVVGGSGGACPSLPLEGLSSG